MPVIYNEDDKTITLHTAHTSYQIKILDPGFLLHTYYGPTAQGDMSYLLSWMNRGFSVCPHECSQNGAISADTLPMEYPCEGSGDHRATAFSLRRSSGVSGCDLRYVSHTVKPGKYALPGLPAVHTDSVDDAETLEVLLADANAGVQVLLQYGILPERDVITRTARVTNTGSEPITLQNAASVCLDWMSGSWDMIHFSGRHTKEREPVRFPLRQDEVVVGSRRGTSSHQQNPFVILADHETTERDGLCCGVSLLYSGSFACNAGVDQYRGTRLLLGVQPERFDYPLAPGESFQAPEAAIALTEHGLTGLSHLFHTLIQRNIVRGPWRDRRRPILINNWEATQMSFTRDRILDIARKASELGVEMMVLDDGWFGNRTEQSGLGDWTVNRDRVGGTMGELAGAIRDMGMKFGLWIEPEMVSENSDLFRAHPDWALRIPGKDPTLGRNQLVLDFSRPEIVDAIFNQIAAVLDDCQADYVKMDMNRPLCEVCTATEGIQSQGAVLYRYVLGVYRFMEKLLERYPNLLLEGCSGGGGRFDAGMLYYCPQIWCSDNTDAIERLAIQYGTSFGYPVSTMGAHVSAVPNWGTWRSTPFHTRAVVAMSGTFGYELDPNELSDGEREEIRRQVEYFKNHWELLQRGRYYRLTDVIHQREFAAWMTVAEDGSEALVNIVTLDSTSNAPNQYVRCAGLDAGAVYRDADTGQRYPAGALMSQGMLLPREVRDTLGFHFETSPSEYRAFQIHLVRE